MKKISLALLGLLALQACNSSNSGKTSIIIDAPGKEEIIISMLSPDAVTNLDTLKSTDGKFSYEIAVDTADFMMITSGNARVPFFVTGTENIEIKLGEEILGGVSRYEISGNAESARIKEITDKVYDAGLYIDSIGNIIGQYRDSANFIQVRAEQQKNFEAKAEETSLALRALIDEDPGNMANLFVWPQSLGNIQLVNAEEHLEYYSKVEEAINERYPNNPHAVNFSKQLELTKQQIAMTKAMEEKQNALSFGNPAPDIALPDTSGTIRKLSDLKGQVVLVDFWAAWCRPCRAANPTVVKIYNQYKDRGFTVFSVSFDGLRQQSNPRAEWLKAIKDDQLSWPNHVSDLKGWESAAGQIYGIQSIPFTVLVDQDGNIVKTRVDLNELPSILDQLLG